MSKIRFCPIFFEPKELKWQKRTAEYKTEPRDPEARQLYLSHTSVLLFWQSLGILRNYFSQADKSVGSTYLSTTIILRITEWFGLKVTEKAISFQTSSMGRDTFHETWLIQAPSKMALDTSTDENSILTLVFFYRPQTRGAADSYAHQDGNKLEGDLSCNNYSSASAPETQQTKRGALSGYIVAMLVAD